MDTRKFAMNYGTVLGLCLALIALLLWVLDVDEQTSIIPSVINNLLVIGFLFYSVSYYRDNFNNGIIAYSQSLKIGTSIAFFSSVIMAFYTFFYISYLAPDMLVEIINRTEQAILQSNHEISDEELDLALEMTAKFTQPHWLMIMGILGGTFMGFFYSLIISFFVKSDIANNKVK